MSSTSVLRLGDEAASPSRCVALIDMDCFYCACERALDPSLLGVPMAVVQYNPFQGDGSATASGVVALPAEPSSARVVYRNGQLRMPSAANGSIIAVSYEARARGVTRFFRGREAMGVCPELVLVQVPTAHGKSDMEVYRSFGGKVLKIVSEVCRSVGGSDLSVEKASVDEMYLDLTSQARALLSSVGQYADVFEEAVGAGTHVAGAVEAAEEAERGAQPTGLLARNSFRAGHAGQVVRSIDDSSARWWGRDAALWTEEELLLAAGAAIVSRARAQVTRTLGFTCSAGIAANKLLAKLCGGLHKPDQQTLLPHSAVAALLDPLPMDRLRGFGGKLGELLRRGRPELGLAGFDTAGQMRRAGVGVVARVLRGVWSHPEEVAAAACRMAVGIDDAAVQERPLAKQVGSSKTFAGGRGSARGPLHNRAALETWVRELAQDVADRLSAEASNNGRVASTLVAMLRFEDDRASKWTAARSRRCPLRDASAAGIARDGLALLLELAAGRPMQRLGVTLLSLSAEGLEACAPVPDARGCIHRFLAPAPAKPASAAAVAEASASGSVAAAPSAATPPPAAAAPAPMTASAVAPAVATAPVAAANAPTAAASGALHLEPTLMLPEEVELYSSHACACGVAAAAGRRPRASEGLPSTDEAEALKPPGHAHSGLGEFGEPTGARQGGVDRGGDERVVSATEAEEGSPPACSGVRAFEVKRARRDVGLSGRHSQASRIEGEAAVAAVATASSGDNGGGQWACRACTLNNADVCNRCKLCGALRGSDLAAATTLREQDRGAVPRASAAARGAHRSRQIKPVGPKAGIAGFLQRSK